MTTMAVALDRNLFLAYYSIFIYYLFIYYLLFINYLFIIYYLLFIYLLFIFIYYLAYYILQHNITHSIFRLNAVALFIPLVEYVLKVSSRNIVFIENNIRLLKILDTTTDIDAFEIYT